MLDFRITTFLSVCKYMNYTKAAEMMHITQPAVTQHIHFLEKEYQTKLFSYNGKKLYLTRAGEVLLQACTTMTHDVATLKSELAHISTGQDVLSFGATLTVGEYLLPPILTSYLQSNPQTELHMKVDNTNDLLEDLKNGDLDFAIIEGYFPKTDFDYLPFSHEEFIAVCGKHYDFHHIPIHADGFSHAVSIHDLFQERLIIREPGSGSRNILERFLSNMNCQISDFTNIATMNNIHVIKELVLQNCGITFLYRAAVEKELKENLLQEIPIKNLDLSHEITFLWNKNSIYSNTYMKFYDLFRVRNKL